MHPLAELWPRLTPSLRSALASTHHAYGRLSTGKAVRGLRGLGGPAAVVLDEMASSTKVPGAATIDPADTEVPTPLHTSPCVRHTASALLSEEGPVDDARFLATLARVSVGSTASRWKRDGFTGERVARMLREV